MFIFFSFSYVSSWPLATLWNWVIQPRREAINREAATSTQEQVPLRPSLCPPGETSGARVLLALYVPQGNFWEVLSLSANYSKD